MRVQLTLVHAAGSHWMLALTARLRLVTVLCKCSCCRGMSDRVLCTQHGQAIRLVSHSPACGPSSQLFCPPCGRRNLLEPAMVQPFRVQRTAQDGQACLCSAVMERIAPAVVVTKVFTAPVRRCTSCLTQACHDYLFCLCRILCDTACPMRPASVCSSSSLDVVMADSLHTFNMD